MTTSAVMLLVVFNAVSDYVLLLLPLLSVLLLTIMIDDFVAAAAHVVTAYDVPVAVAVVIAVTDFAITGVTNAAVVAQLISKG